MISFKSSGSTKNLESFLNSKKRMDLRSVLNRYGQDGVRALESNTPKESGLAATSWDYSIETTRTGFSITWTNSDTESGFPVALMLQYGYATGTGGYVQGRDYINPAMRPVFDRIADQLWKEVTRG